MSTALHPSPQPLSPEYRGEGLRGSLSRYSGRGWGVGLWTNPVSAISLSAYVLTFHAAAADMDRTNRPRLSLASHLDGFKECSYSGGNHASIFRTRPRDAPNR